jgi:hypothetical protein
VGSVSALLKKICLIFRPILTDENPLRQAE